MEKSKEELLDYAVKMRIRGDSYRSMLSYLKNNSSDENIINEIIKEIDQLEKNKNISTNADHKTKISSVNFLMGYLFLVSGIVLIYFLWGKGFISTVPFILIGIGIWALVGGDYKERRRL